MKKLLLTLTSLCGLVTGAAFAGPNAGGTLILHTNDALIYCQDNTTYCASSGLTSCETADNSVEATGIRVWWVIAAFPAGSSPRLSALTFAVTYSPTSVWILTHGACADLELAESGWPAPDTGTALTWNSARTTLLTTVYWFAGYDYDEGVHPNAFALTSHSGGGSNFADDSVPSKIDPVAGLGTLGFGAPGTTPCPNPPGACCFTSGECTVVTQSTCASWGGNYQGNGTTCSPNPCPQPPVYGACCVNYSCTITTEADCTGAWYGAGSSCDPSPCPPAPVYGACCLATGECLITTQGDCDAANGDYQGDNTTCDPNPCTPPVPTEKSSWGKIKKWCR